MRHTSSLALRKRNRKNQKLPEFFEAKEIGSYQAYFGISDEEIEKMANLTEKIFIEIYNLPETVSYTHLTLPTN